MRGTLMWIHAMKGPDVSDAPFGTSVDAAVDRGPTVLRIVLGSRLRQLREACGYSREQAGEAIRASHSKISRLELGKVSFRERDITDLLTLYGVTDTDERSAFSTLARQANASGWWHRESDWLPRWFDTYLGLELAAKLIRCYEPRIVPELLQTADYARCLLSIAHPDETEETIDRRVALRMRRQKILTRVDPPKLWVVIEEAALRRPIGGHSVWRTQLDHVIRIAQSTNITVQVLADQAGGPAIADGPFTVLRFAADSVPDVVYLQHLTSASYLDKRADLDAYLTAADRLSVQAADPRQSLTILSALGTGVAPPDPSATRG